MIPTLSPVSGQPALMITHGTDTFRLTCCEAFGLNGGTPYHQTSDGINYSGTGVWMQDGNQLYMKRSITDYPQIDYELLIQAWDGIADLTMGCRNKSGAGWTGFNWADFCLQCDPSMTHSVALYDPDGSHTFIPATPERGGGMQPVSSQGPDEIAAYNRAHFYLPGVNPNYPPVAGCIIARSNATMDKWVAMYFEGSPGLFTNLLQGNCIHSNPSFGALGNGAEIACRGRITFNCTSLAEVCANTPI